MRTYITFAILLTVCSAKFFPDWSNCDNTTELQFIDFYFEDKPDIKGVFTNVTDPISNNFTMCAGQGKNITLGRINAQLIKDNSTILLDQDLSAFDGDSFDEGKFSHCFKVSMPQFLIPAGYDLVLQVYGESDDTDEIGCLDANWNVELPIVA